MVVAAAISERMVYWHILRPGEMLEISSFQAWSVEVHSKKTWSHRHVQLTSTLYNIPLHQLFIPLLSGAILYFPIALGPSP